MAGLTITTDASDEPLSLQETKDYLRLDSQTDDTIVRSFLINARQFVEEYLGRSLITKTYKYSMDYVEELDIPLWEGTKVGPDMTIRRRYVTLPRPPLIAVTSITAFDDSDTGTVFSTDKYYVDNQREQGRVILRNGETWPTALRVANAIEIVYTAGYGADPTDVPEPIRLAMLQYITYMYENRGDTNDMPKMPASIVTLLQPYRVLGLGNPFGEYAGKY